MLKYETRRKFHQYVLMAFENFRHISVILTLCETLNFVLIILVESRPSNPMSQPIRPGYDDNIKARVSDANPINIAHYEALARNYLPRNAFDYYASGANDMITLKENRAAYSRIQLLPRVLKDVHEVDTSVTVLGCRVTSPICVAPTAMQKMAHPDGELATVRSAAK